MTKFVLIIAFISAVGKCFPQDTTKAKPYVYQGITKNECKKIMNERINFLTGTWTFVRADFGDTNLQVPIAKHSIAFKNRKFLVTNDSSSTPTQSGKIKFTKDKIEVLEFCCPLIWFGNPNKQFPGDAYFDSNEPYELPKYYHFYHIAKCDKDSLVIYTPMTNGFKSIEAKRFDYIIKRFVRQK